MPGQWSILCHTTTCFWLWFLLGYSVSVIAYASYGMGQAKAAQCLPLDDMIWLLNTARPFRDHPLRRNGSDVDANAAVEAPGLAAVEQCVARVDRVAEENRRSLSPFALSPPWTRAFWAGIGLFACYWVLFGVFLASTAVGVCRDAFGTGDGVEGMEGRDGPGCEEEAPWRRRLK